MNITSKTTYLLLAMLSIVLLSCLGSWMRYDFLSTDIFFSCPPLNNIPREPFDLSVFIPAVIGTIAVVFVYMHPSFFDFKIVSSPQNKSKRNTVNLPLWFWDGLFLLGSVLWFLWSETMYPLWYSYWSCLPLFLGAIMMINTWGYVRTSEISFLNICLLVFACICHIHWYAFEKYERRTMYLLISVLEL